MKLDRGTPSNLIKDIMKNISTKNDAFVRLVTIILLILLTSYNTQCFDTTGHAPTQTYPMYFQVNTVAHGL